MKILVFGSNGLVGSSVTRTLRNASYETIASNRQDTNLFNFDETKKKITEENQVLLSMRLLKLVEYLPMTH